MEKLLLVGAGGFGRVVLEHASQEYECAFVDDADVAEVDGAPIVGRIDDIESLYGEYKLLIVTIGNNKLRERIYKRAEEILLGGEVNTGFTYTDPDKHLTIIVIGLTDSAEQFANTYDHEKGHAATHIAQYYDLDPYGEKF